MSTRDHDDNNDDDAEAREAAALARALDGAPDAAAAAPADALEAAALLRSAGAGARAAAGEEALVARLGPTLAARRARHRRRVGAWVASGLVLPAAAAVALLVAPARVGQGPAEPPTAAARRTPPPPPRALLAAQAAATRGGPGALAALDVQMRAYRRVFFAERQVVEAARSGAPSQLVQDDAYQLARRALDAGNPRGALAHAVGALARAHGGAPPDLFVANLHVVHGAALEALGDASAAAAAYHEALVINDRLLGEALEGAP